MSTTLLAADVVRKLPPQPRDWLVYRLVKIELLSTRAAAERLGISQTRVCQLIERVVEFMTDVAPGEETPEARARRLYVAESVAAERVDHLYGQAVENFRESVGPQTTVRETPSDCGPPKTTNITKWNAGDPRLLAGAARLALFASKIPVNTLLPIQPDEMAAEEEHASAVAATTDHPQVEDCSTTDVAEQVASGPSPRAANSTAMPTTDCESPANNAPPGNSVASRPVQPRPTGTEGETSAEPALRA